MGKSTRYTVTAPLVVVPAPDGGDRYCYQGDALPDDIDESLRNRLVEQKLVKPAGSRSSNGED